MRPLLVIFEGVDKSGKSTLYKAFRKRTAWGPLAIERFTGSNIAYDWAYDRPASFDLIGAEHDLLSVFDVRMVYCQAGITTIKARIEKEEIGEQREIALRNFEKVLEKFDEYLKVTPFPYIIVDTANPLIEDCIRQVLDFILKGRA